MIPRTILVGTDFSPASDVACLQALGVARRCGARMVIAHAAAIPDKPEGVPDSMRSTAEFYLGALRERLATDRDQLDDLGERLSGQGVEVSHVLVDGFADEGLPTAAHDLGADLIVTGAHGRRGLGRLLLGSTAERVVRVATVPVLVARGSADAATGGFHRIIVATDFSEAAERGLDLALEVAAPDATVELVHFWQIPSLSRAHATDEVDATIADIRADMEEHGNRRGAESLASRDTSRAKVHYQLREGDTRDGIVDLAKVSGADLVVIGGHGHRGLRRFLLGSVADSTVRHAPLQRPRRALIDVAVTGRRGRGGRGAGWSSTGRRRWRARGRQSRRTGCGRWRRSPRSAPGAGRGRGCRGRGRPSRSR
jgi:nucleotide-binding universal stress UspA family protein